MSSTRTSAKAIGFAVLALFSASPGAHPQGGAMPVPPGFESSTADAKPCVPDSARRHEMANPSDSLLFAPTGDPDRDFAHMMSAHHREGVDMAKRQIANGKSSKLKAMARRIIKDQEREIVELDKWSARHNVRLTRREPP